MNVIMKTSSVFTRSAIGNYRFIMVINDLLVHNLEMLAPPLPGCNMH